jgi:cytosine/adenosine deaminase-related metal-dependent hydrolase
MLITGGTVLTMDPSLGDLERGDLLVEGGRIVAVAPEPEAADAAVVDASGALVLPGFVDTHRHTWQASLPIPAWSTRSSCAGGSSSATAG